MIDESGVTHSYVGSFKEAKEMCKDSDGEISFYVFEFPANRQGLLNALNAFGMDN
jgi:hypothetical protein